MFQGGKEDSFNSQLAGGHGPFRGLEAPFALAVRWFADPLGVRAQAASPFGEQRGHFGHCGGHTRVRRIAGPAPGSNIG